MIATEEKAEEWYNKNGIANKDWGSFNKLTKDLIRLETTLDSFDEINHMREIGIPESAVVAFIKPNDIGIDTTILENIQEEQDCRDISSHIMQNSTRNIKRIFLLTDMEVLMVDYDGEFIQLEIEPRI